MVLTIKTLDSFLSEATDILKVIMDPSVSKQYIMGLLFLKRLSDQFNEDLNNIGSGDDPEDPDNYQYFIPEEARWETLRKKSEGIGKAIDNAFQKIEEHNQEKLEGVLTPIQFYQPKTLTDAKLAKLMIHFSTDGFNLANANLQTPKVIGQAYTALIEKVAEASGKSGGDFYTTKEVVQLLVKLLAPEEGMRICDPVCGSGGFLIECSVFIDEQGKDAQNLALYGEEVNTGTWTIAKMNLLLHNIFDAEVKRGNTMQDPFLKQGKLMRFDLCVGNPIWNQKDDGWAFELFDRGDPFGRATYGMSTKSSGDWMWVQHMLATLKEDGRMGIVLDNGALFRGSREGNIRKAIVEANLIEGVIALPPNLFKGTGSPGCLIIFNKQKKTELENKIFFIHAENEYEEGKAQNCLREKNISKIVKTYQDKSVLEKFSELIEIAEIKENDFNLNVSRYIDILPEEEPVDLSECWKQVELIQVNRKTLESQLDSTMKELGIK